MVVVMVVMVVMVVVVVFDVVVVMVVMVVRKRDSIPDEGGGRSPWMFRRDAAFINFVQQNDVNYHTVAALRLD